MLDINSKLSRQRIFNVKHNPDSPKFFTLFFSNDATRLSCSTSPSNINFQASPSFPFISLTSLRKVLRIPAELLGLANCSDVSSDSDPWDSECAERESSQSSSSSPETSSPPSPSPPNSSSSLSHSSSLLSLVPIGDLLDLLPPEGPEGVSGGFWQGCEWKLRKN